MTDAAHLSEMPAVGSALQLKTQSTNTNLKAEVIGYSSVEQTSLLQKLTCYTGSQCYLPPGWGDTPTFTPAKAGIQFRSLRGMQGWVNLGTAVKVCSLCPKAAYCIGCHNKNNHLWWDLNLGPLTLQSDVLTTRPLQQITYWLLLLLLFSKTLSSI